MNGIYIILDNGNILRVNDSVSRIVEEGCVLFTSATGTNLLISLRRVDAIVPVSDTLDIITELMGKLHPGVPVVISE